MPLTHLDTPCLTLDHQRLRQNIQQMREHINALGVRLRPHLKTAKSVHIAKMLAAHGASSFTVSTLAEAKYFCEAGFSDLLYAVSITPDKFKKVQALNSKGHNISVLLSNLSVLPALAALGGNRITKVWIELDVDGLRTGVAADSAELLQLAQAIRDIPTLKLQGVLSHSGGSYQVSTTEDASKAEQLAAHAAHIAQAALAEQQQARLAKTLLLAAGFRDIQASIGTTPSATFSTVSNFNQPMVINLNNQPVPLATIDEIRAGVYVFQDLYQAELGVCTKEQIALAVVSSVISHSPTHNRIVIDAGSLAMSKDLSCQSLSSDVGYGLVCDEQRQPIAGLKFYGSNQEHGYITSSQPIDFSQFAIGRRLLILPNHACITAAAYSHYQVLMPDGQWQRWHRCNGW